MIAPELLALMQSRRSTRRFADRPVARADLEPLFEAARTAPSATNRQPWRYNAVLDPALRARIIEAVRGKVDALRAELAGSEYLADLTAYGDFFHEPLEAAPALIIPQYRLFPDAIAALLARAGRDPRPYALADRMPSELCGAAAATMNLLLMAHAAGLAACWMAGPMLAREEIAALLALPAPFVPLGAIAIGYPAAETPAPARKPTERIVEWNLPA
ncbi:MAG: nitroreductase family protein [Myxococcales bacterium]|nr:nitroreductase family protein [Myxococcales bacterium]